MTAVLTAINQESRYILPG